MEPRLNKDCLYPRLSFSLSIRLDFRHFKSLTKMGFDQLSSVVILNLKIPKKIRLTGVLSSYIQSNGRYALNVNLFYPTRMQTKYLKNIGCFYRIFIEEKRMKTN